MTRSPKGQAGPPRRNETGPWFVVRRSWSQARLRRHRVVLALLLFLVGRFSRPPPEGVRGGRERRVQGSGEGRNAGPVLSRTDLEHPDLEPYLDEQRNQFEPKTPLQFQLAAPSATRRPRRLLASSRRVRTAGMPWRINTQGLSALSEEQLYTIETEVLTFLGAVRRNLRKRWVCDLSHDANPTGARYHGAGRGRFRTRAGRSRREGAAAAVRRAGGLRALGSGADGAGAAGSAREPVHAGLRGAGRAYRAQVTDKTNVVEPLGISWRCVRARARLRTTDDNHEPRTTDHALDVRSRSPARGRRRARRPVSTR